MLGDYFRVAAENACQTAYERSFRSLARFAGDGFAIRCGSAVAVGLIGNNCTVRIHRFSSNFHHRAVGQNDLQTFDVLSSRAVFQPVTSRGIQCDDAAHRRDGAVRGIGPEQAPEVVQMLIQQRMNDARLNADRFRLGADDAPHVAGEIDDQSAAQRFAGQPAAGAAGMYRQPILGGVFYDSSDVGRIAWPHHRQRRQLINAGIAGEKLEKNFVAPHIAGDQTAQIVLNALAFWIHDGWS